MASRVSPRSASDATRFTSTTPHAASKAAAPSTPKPKQQQPSPHAKTPAATKLSSTPKNPSGGNRLPGETPEERVRRLRAAHEAARKAQTSSVDRVLGGSRRFFDVAHKATVIGLVGFTGTLREHVLPGDPAGPIEPQDRHPISQAFKQARTQY